MNKTSKGSDRGLRRSIAKAQMLGFGEHEFVNSKGDVIKRPGLAQLFKKKGEKEDRRSIFARKWREFTPGGEYYKKAEKRRKA